MTFLPIVGRELRAASRRSRTYWARVVAGGAAIIGLVVVMTVMQFNRGVTAQSVGSALFQTLVWLDFLLCLAIGIQLTSDSISEEKREGTLGFLFLTDLKGYDVILGKLSATSLTAGYAMITSLPVLGVTMLLGGVSLAELGRATLVLLNTLMFSLGAGIFISTLCRESRTSGALTFLMLTLGCLTVPAAGLAWMLWENNGYMRVTTAFQATLAMNPICACYMVPSGPLIPWMFWVSCLFVFGMSCLFLTAAAWMVRRTWQDRPATARGQRWREWWRNRLQGDRGTRKSYRSRLLDVNAVLWLTSRNRLKAYYMWAYFAMAVAFWLWGWLRVGSDWWNFAMTVGICFVNHLVLKMAVATEAGERYGLDLQSGALELLLATRMKVDDFLRGQILALRRHFLWPTVAVLLMDGFLLAGSWQFGRDNPGDKPGYAANMAAGMVMLVTDLGALGWVGMWTGLTARDVKKASGAALASVLLPPCLVVLVFRLIWMVAHDQRDFPATWSAGLLLGFSLLLDFAAGAWARQRLRAEFRLFAMRRYDPAPAEQGSIWARMWRQLFPPGVT